MQRPRSPVTEGGAAVTEGRERDRPVARERERGERRERGHMFDYTCVVIIYEMCVQEPTATPIKDFYSKSNIICTWSMILVPPECRTMILFLKKYMVIISVQLTKVRQQEKLKYPPHPLNTIELEKRASRYFRMSSEQTMKVAEDLYQTGFISYPRTETDSFSERTDLRAIVQEQGGHPIWGSYAQRLLDPGEGLWRNAVTPRRKPCASLACFKSRLRCATSAKRLAWDQFRRTGCASMRLAPRRAFNNTGWVTKNYLDVYRFESWGGSMIPTYTFGQQFIPTTLTLDSGVTRPPSLLSETDLLNCMDKAGIGADATMHDHIKKLLDRFYATKDFNTRFSPTNLGEALVMGYDDMGYELWKPYLRAMMENDMKAVSIGTKRKAEVLSTCLEQMKACFLDARLNKVKLFEAMGIFFERCNSRSGADEQHAVGDAVRRCGVCQESDMVLKRKPDGNFMVGCLGYPQNPDMDLTILRSIWEQLIRIV
ncbi:hypothetical protein HYC85_001493 [Camellia sinensis]|uniref:DNA topoisomerase n=1 Tax=Camellia sinensis TaxID=4442 RepID=A0A7J7I7F2_CAMSI|nr:hypothetical protein HYC85_001493 [Camellia sinensis]